MILSYKSVKPCSCAVVLMTDVLPCIMHGSTSLGYVGSRGLSEQVRIHTSLHLCPLFDRINR